MSLTSWASEKQLQRENLYELVHSVCWSLNGAKIFAIQQQNAFRIFG